MVAELAVELLLLAGRLHDVGDALEQVLVPVERLHDQELAEEAHVLGEGAEQEELERRLAPRLRARRLPRPGKVRVEQVEARTQRAGVQARELAVQAQDVEQVRVRVLVPDLALRERVPDGADLGLLVALVEVAPERLDGHLHLRDRQHGVLDGAPFHLSHAGVEVVDVLGEVVLGVEPVGVPDGVAVVEELRVLGGPQLATGDVEAPAARRRGADHGPAHASQLEHTRRSRLNAWAALMLCW